MNCLTCQQRWCSYRGTDGSLVYKCSMYLEHVPTTTSDGAYISPSVAMKKEVPRASKLTDVELLTEFKRRFQGSVLYDCNIVELLYIIDDVKLNEFIKSKIVEE